MKPAIGSKWIRGNNPLSLGDGGEPYFYTVINISNLGHLHHRHKPQVIYQGDNGLVWSVELEKWPANLIEVDANGSPI